MLLDNLEYVFWQNMNLFKPIDVITSSLFVHNSTLTCCLISEQLHW